MASHPLGVVSGMGMEQCMYIYSMQHAAYDIWIILTETSTYSHYKLTNKQTNSKRPTTHTVDDNSSTPLPICPQHQILQHLTHHGPGTILAQTRDALQTPLHVLLTHCCSTRTAETLGWLAGGGAVRGTLPNEALGLVDGRGRLALHCAVGGSNSNTNSNNSSSRVRCSRDVVKKLVSGYSPGLEAQDLEGNVPLHCYLRSAAAHSQDDGEEEDALSSSMIGLLLTPMGASLRNTAHQTLLHLAVRSLHAVPNKSLRHIIDANRSALVARDGEGRTPLHLFFRSNANAKLKFSKKQLDLLLQPICEDDVRTSAIRVEDAHGRLPLHYAVASELNLLQVVLEGYEEGVLHVDHAGLTPLHYLFADGAAIVDMDTLLALLQSHTNTPQILDGASNLALHHACAMGGIVPEVLAVLLEQGGANLVNDNGMLPVHCAIMGAVDPSDVTDDVIIDKLATVDASVVEMLLQPLSDDVNACKLAGVADLYPLVIATQQHIADVMSDDVILSILKNYPDAVEYITDVDNLAEPVVDALFVYSEDKTSFGDLDERLTRLANLTHEECIVGDMSDVSKLFWKWLCSDDDVSNADHVTTIITGLANLAVQDLIQQLTDVNVTSSAQTVLDACQYFCGLFVLGDVIHRSADVIILDGYMQSHGTQTAATPVVLKFMVDQMEYKRAAILAGETVEGVVSVLRCFSVEGDSADDRRFQVDLEDRDRFGDFLGGTFISFYFYFFSIFNFFYFLIQCFQ